MVLQDLRGWQPQQASQSRAKAPPALMSAPSMRRTDQMRCEPFHDAGGALVEADTGAGAGVGAGKIFMSLA